MKKCVLVAVFSQLLFLSLPLSAQSNASCNPDYLEHLLDHYILFDTMRPEPSQNVMAGDRGEWKQWHTVENYSFGTNRGSLPMIADLQALHPYFRDKVAALIQTCKAAGIELVIVESYRTAAKQAEYFAMGKEYTNTPGGKSRHQYGLAVDVVPIVDSVAVWNNARLWRKIGAAGERLGLRWGGRWRVVYDPGHFEWSGGLSVRELEAGALPSIPSSLSARYPNIQEDLKLLQTYWEAWQAEQSVMARMGIEQSENSEATGAGN